MPYRCYKCKKEFYFDRGHYMVTGITEEGQYDLEFFCFKCTRKHVYAEDKVKKLFSNPSHRFGDIRR